VGIGVPSGANLKLDFAYDLNLYAPTMARDVPVRSGRRNGFSVTNAPRGGAKLTYVKLNSQTPCPPRGAVAVNQGCCRRLFHSEHPVRLR
jgi:hypothetical protein